jgi:hypothetical protein
VVIDGVMRTLMWFQTCDMPSIAVVAQVGPFIQIESIIPNQGGNALGLGSPVVTRQHNTTTHCCYSYLLYSTFALLTLLYFLYGI